jgi:hypothetical protein
VAPVELQMQVEIQDEDALTHHKHDQIFVDDYEVELSPL